LRGSGRFVRCASANVCCASGFNPLHCGAVVASTSDEEARVQIRQVSIPFIAGQWSLRGGARRKHGSDSCFNPLHCGAVVASVVGAARVSRRRRVSIPFIAGQWSLHPHAYALIKVWRRVSIPFIAGQWSLPSVSAAGAVQATRVSIPFIAGQWSLPLSPHCRLCTCFLFQSPSLRGSGRFLVRGVPGATLDICFNPLHCGAVVASGVRLWTPTVTTQVSIPFIAGQWSLRSPNGGPGMTTGRRVSIPFIAGQWSLRRRSKRPNLTPRRFNPLHCGAVVASRLRHVLEQDPALVSIPFIAGQWSLLLTAPLAAWRGRASFNPLHCGAVVASRRASTCSGRGG